MLKKILIGLFAGTINGLFASGGGMIIVPLLIHLLKMEDWGARATSIMIVLPITIVSGLFYYKNNLINWKLGLLCGIGGVIGGFIGAKMLKKMSKKILRITFTCFLVYVSLRMII